jgi:hypothetical protein
MLRNNIKVKAFGIALIVASIVAMIFHFLKYYSVATDGCPDIYIGVSLTSYFAYALDVGWYIVGWLLAFLLGVYIVSINILKKL